MRLRPDSIRTGGTEQQQQRLTAARGSLAESALPDPLLQFFSCLFESFSLVVLCGCHILLPLFNLLGEALRFKPMLLRRSAIILLFSLYYLQ